MLKPLVIAISLFALVLLTINVIIPEVSRHLSTRWAPGFTEERFAQVRPGMTVAEVRRILGEPLRIYTNRLGTIYWEYTGEKRPKSANLPFWYRRSLAITGATVIAVDRSFAD